MIHPTAQTRSWALQKQTSAASTRRQIEAAIVATKFERKACEKERTAAVKNWRAAKREYHPI